MDQIVDVLTCITCRHPAQEHRDYLGCHHPVYVAGDDQPLTCVCLDLDLGM
jgi:hypothetical protein